MAANHFQQAGTVTGGSWQRTHNGKAPLLSMKLVQALENVHLGMGETTAGQWIALSALTKRAASKVSNRSSKQMTITANNAPEVAHTPKQPQVDNQMLKCANQQFLLSVEMTPQMTVATKQRRAWALVKIGQLQCSTQHGKMNFAHQMELATQQSMFQIIVKALSQCDKIFWSVWRRNKHKRVKRAKEKRWLQQPI